MSVEPETGVSEGICAIPTDYQAKSASKQVKWLGSQVYRSLREISLEELSARGTRPNIGKTLRSCAQLRFLSLYACNCLCRRQLGESQDRQPATGPSEQAQLPVRSALYVFPTTEPSS